MADFFKKSNPEEKSLIVDEQTAARQISTNQAVSAALQILAEKYQNQFPSTTIEPQSPTIKN